LTAHANHPAGDRGLVRLKHGHGHHRVTFVELFFDLVFVFAVTQLSHSLIEHFSALDVLQTTLLTLAVWWTWMYTTWVTNWLHPDRLPVRVGLLALMLPGLILSASIPQAFEGRGLAFAGAYVVMHCGRAIFVLWAVRGHPILTRNYKLILCWLTLASLFWMAGAFVPDEQRLLVWSVALAIDLAAPWAGYWVPVLGRSRTTDWEVEGGHMSERCALFIIIALGESLLVTGATFAGLPWTTEVVLALVVSFLSSVAMWWLYFDTSADVGTRTISDSRDPGRIARLVYTYIHLLLVGGIILAAVGDEFVLVHPLGHTDWPTAIAVTGGPFLFVLGAWLFKWAIVGHPPFSPLVALASFGGLLASAPLMPPVILMTLATVVLIASAIWEARTAASCPVPTPSVAAHPPTP
jgi:low temperature requirement protein LtrA